MIDQLVTSILFDVAVALRDEKSLPAFAAFLQQPKDDTMLQALGNVSKRFVQHAVIHDDSASTRILEEALLRFVTTDLRDALYSQDFSGLPAHTSKALTEMLKLFGEGQIAYALAELASKLGKTPIALVQSPLALSPAEKRRMIGDLTKTTPLFPLFVVRRELVGGVRVLLGDSLFDDTFHTQLQRLFAAVS